MNNCVLACYGKECGPDGCGGTCGECDFGTNCTGGQCVPDSVTIVVLDAVIGPGKADGGLWDGWGNVPVDVAAELAAVVDAGITSQILNFVTSVAMQTLEKPDPNGYIQLNEGWGYGEKVWLASDTTNTEDTFTPVWPDGGKGWGDVPFTEEVKVKIALFDEDVANDDDIGVAVMNYDDFLEAWAAKEKFYVNVADQTQNQLLLVGIEVY